MNALENILNTLDIEVDEYIDNVLKEFEELNENKGV